MPLLQEYLARQAEQRPGDIALAMDAVRLSYGEVESSSNRLAHFLADEAGCKRGDRVCLFVPKDPAAICAMHAVLKADCAYVPIDIASPAARVAKIVESAEPRLILASSASVALLDQLVASGELDSSVPIGFIDETPGGERFAAAFTSADWGSAAAEPVSWRNGPSDPAHILFTSGSTGMPKGVVIKHENAVAFVEWSVEYFGIEASDRNSGHPPLHFDLSTFDIYATFCAGAQLHVVPSRANLLPQKLAQLIRDAELTQWFSVPSTMTFMAKGGVIEKDDFPTLRRVLWCGEVLPTPILIHWMERVTHARYTNLYGPTEATIASSYYTVSERPADGTQAIPIGSPCTDEELMVLDDKLEPVATGETGDLYIAGVGLSPGYWRDEEKTAAAFLEDPRAPGSDRRIYRTGDLARAGDDGLFYFLGRADSQIKSRGYRIELGEIETALNALEDLSECAVVGVDTEGFQGTEICCAYAAREGREATPTSLRSQLTKALPSYMLPTRWMDYAVLPKNVNGKIDRRKLRERFEEEAQVAARAKAAAEAR